MTKRTDASPGAPPERTLWDPVDLHGRTVRNRLAVAPMSRVSTDGDGVPTEQMRDYYRDFADGGFGLVITEGIYPVGPSAQGYAAQPGLVTPEHVDGWRRVTDAVHQAGALVFAQLMHAGALSQHLSRTLAPSAVEPLAAKLPEYGGDGPYPIPAELTGAQIQEIVEGFASSAELAAEAGFDGVEVHAANGYLLDQFLTDYTNTRPAPYGGTPAARARLVGEVVAAVRRSTTGRLVVGVRLSQAKVNDAHYKWRDAHEAAAILRSAASGRPDYVHLAGEGKPWTQSGRAADGTSLSALTRDLTSAAIIVNGGLHAPGLAQEAIAGGQADMVSLGRGALGAPDWPAATRAGTVPRPFRPDMISPSANLQNTIQSRTAHLEDGSSGQRAPLGAAL